MLLRSRLGERALVYGWFYTMTIYVIIHLYSINNLLYVSVCSLIPREDAGIEHHHPQEKLFFSGAGDAKMEPSTLGCRLARCWLHWLWLRAFVLGDFHGEKYGCFWFWHLLAYQSTYTSVVQNDKMMSSFFCIDGIFGVQRLTLDSYSFSCWKKHGGSALKGPPCSNFLWSLVPFPFLAYSFLQKVAWGKNNPNGKDDADYIYIWYSLKSHHGHGVPNL